jgi:Phosphotransferase enzyme family
MAKDLVELLADALRSTRPLDEDAMVQREILATADDRECASLLLGTIGALEGPVADVLFASVSVGVVVGVALADGRRVVTKVQRNTVPTASILAGQEGQRLAISAGLPAPNPSVGVFVVANGQATVEELVDHGVHLDVRPTQVRAAFARDLARLVAALASMHDHPGLARPELEPRVREGSPFPPPHSPLFDFAASAEGATWIDDAGWAALEIIRDRVGPTVVMHSDWRTENVRMDADGSCVSAIYDWDSLRCGEEAVLIGSVARAFSTNWRLDNPMIPTRADLFGFIADYEVARGAAFDPDQMKRCRAGVIHALAYSARCEHALGARVTWGEGFRGLLRELLAD